jgi:hypothetical protein
MLTEKRYFTYRCDSKYLVNLIIVDSNNELVSGQVQN